MAQISSKVVNISEHSSALNEAGDLSPLLTLQAKKIQSLLEENEILGAQIQDLKLEIDRTANFDELQEWHSRVFQRLGPDIDTANHHLDVLFARSRQLEYPGHRIASWANHRIGPSWIGRAIKWVLRTSHLMRNA